MSNRPANWPAFFAPGAIPPAPGYRLPAGFLLCDRFRVVKFLAEGGMGSVYEAEDLELREHVAIKTLRAEIVEDPKLLERFRRETQLSRRVTHPNVCRIYDLFRHIVDPRHPASDVVFLVMELLEGETLLARIRRDGRLRPDEALPVVRQLAGALDAAHGAAVVHRDFKSANIILVPAKDGGVPRAVVTDFGIARALDTEPSPGHPELTEVGEAIGTRDYAAPEQLLGLEVTPAADIYALGVVLYEMTTGHRPYEGDEPAPKRFERPPLAPSDLVSSLPERWSAAILRCLARDPAQRFARASDVAAALAGESRRRAAPFAVAAALLLASAALLLVAVKSRTHAEPPPFSHAVQVTRSSRLDAWPAFSADGKELVYSSERTGGFELYRLPLGGAAEREVPLTNDGQQNMHPALSPDGRTVVYASRGRGGLWSMPLAGGAPRMLADFGSRPAFSPDGSLVVFQSETPPSAVGTDFGAMPPSAIWLLSVADGKLQRLTRPGTPSGGHSSPVFSPDGKWIVFCAFDPESAQLFAVRVGGGTPVPLYGGSTYEFDPAVGADGALYYGAITRDWRFVIRRAPVDWRAGRLAGPAVEVAAPGAVIPRHFALSRDGKHLAYAALALRSNVELLPVDAASGAPAGAARALTAETARNSRPVFSPDGRRIALKKWRPGVNMDVFVMPAAGGEALPLTSHPAEDGVPSWFPDSRRIAFLSMRLGHVALFEERAEAGQKEKLLVDLGAEADSPRLSPDGTRVAFNSHRRGGTINTWVADLAGGPPRQVTSDREMAGFPCWSPDGRYLAVQVRRGDDRQVGLVPADGGPLEILTDGPGQSWSDSFSPDGRRIVFAGLRGGAWNLYWVDRTSRAVKQLTFGANPNTYVRYPNWSPRGDSIAYESAETLGNVWMLSR